MTIGAPTDIQWDSPQADIDHWQDVLNGLFPPNLTLSWLKIWWEPGEEWERVERYIIYQMLPFEATPDIFKPWLLGNNPRRWGRYDKVLGEFVRLPDAPGISQQQWKLFQETGCFGRPFWIVQGKRGGHKRNFSHHDRLVLKTIDAEHLEPPHPGDLPYAPVDQRVIDKLVALDNVRKYGLMAEYASRFPERIEEGEQAAFLQAYQGYWDWLEGQVEDTLEQALAESQHTTLRDFAEIMQ